MLREYAPDAIPAWPSACKLNHSDCNRVNSKVTLAVSCGLPSPAGIKPRLFVQKPEDFIKVGRQLVLILFLAAQFEQVSGEYRSHAEQLPQFLILINFLFFLLWLLPEDKINRDTAGVALAQPAPIVNRLHSRG